MGCKDCCQRNLLTVLDRLRKREIGVKITLPFQEEWLWQRITGPPSPSMVNDVTISCMHNYCSLTVKFICLTFVQLNHFQSCNVFRTAAYSYAWEASQVIPFLCHMKCRSKNIYYLHYPVSLLPEMHHKRNNKMRTCLRLSILAYHKYLFLSNAGGKLERHKLSYEIKFTWSKSKHFVAESCLHHIVFVSY